MKTIEPIIHTYIHAYVNFFRFAILRRFCVIQKHLHFQFFQVALNSCSMQGAGGTVYGVNRLKTELIVYFE